ncbi:hypothetical protein BKA70DRAFT_1435731 [Coprinopsis sp. MPI-PUGE-AT-0042]|nr:hypothetical protein BKA70DRAFT_1435731 [Coprinopsis sp. MPI-PUGE-AT-0042]
MSRRRRRRRVKSCGIIENSEDITINGGNFVQAARSAFVTVVTNNSNTNAVNVVLIQVNVNLNLNGHMHDGMVFNVGPRRLSLDGDAGTGGGWSVEGSCLEERWTKWGAYGSLAQYGYVVEIVDERSLDP